MAKVNGQYQAYEVNRIVKPYQSRMSLAEVEHVATVWDEQEAKALNHIINGGLERDIYSGRDSLNPVGVIVLNNEAYYDTAQAPVPVELIASTASEAVAFLVSLSLPVKSAVATT